MKIKEINMEQNDCTSNTKISHTKINHEIELNEVELKHDTHTSPKNVFRDFAYDFYNSDIKDPKNNNHLNNRLKDILQNLEINSWGDFENLFEIGMEKWSKNRINQIKEKTRKDLELLKTMNLDQLLSLNIDIDTELNNINKWKLTMKTMQFEEENSELEGR